MFDILEQEDNKPFKIKGIAMIKNSLSKNGRFYSGKLVESIVDNVSTIIERNGAYPLNMMADHPTITTNKTLSVIGKITKMYLEGDNAIIEAEIANTSIGKDIQELIKGGFVEGLSIRATNGKFKNRNINGKIVKDVLEMDLKGVDLVANPGVDGAKVLDIIESEENPGMFISIDEEEEIVTNKEEPTEMDYSKIVLEEFKEKRPDLLEKLKQDFKPVFESEFNLEDLQESIETLKTEKQTLESEKEELATEKETLESELDTAKNNLQEKEEELKTIKEAEEAAKREAHITSKISELKFAESVKEKLKEKVSVLESIEEIDAMLESEVEFLEAVIAESTGVDIKGKGHTGKNDDIDEEEDFINKVMGY